MSFHRLPVCFGTPDCDRHRNILETGVCVFLSTSTNCKAFEDMLGQSRTKKRKAVLGVPHSLLPTKYLFDSENEMPFSSHWKSLVIPIHHNPCLGVFNLWMPRLGMPWLGEHRSSTENRINSEMSLRYWFLVLPILGLWSVGLNNWSESQNSKLPHICKTVHCLGLSILNLSTGTVRNAWWDHQTYIGLKEISRKTVSMYMSKDIFHLLS